MTTSLLFSLVRHRTPLGQLSLFLWLLFRARLEERETCGCCLSYSSLFCFISQQCGTVVSSVPGLALGCCNLMSRVHEIDSKTHGG